MFSKRLKALRVAKKMSQQELADFLGITRQGYGKYEQSGSQPSFEMLLKIARYFHVSTDYLLGMTDIPNAESEEFKEYLNNPLTSIAFKDFENLTDEQKQEAIEMIKFIKFKESQKE